MTCWCLALTSLSLTTNTAIWAGMKQNAISVNSAVTKAEAEAASFFSRYVVGRG
eukprot:CAMPEP_0173169058 /NCGR_PEP_ID=MMETSP1141-20130122/492_1 /TAXON_ID=483371 /ORGANISM="non described non described, Strain CCMP2298" /LENGTH=53 /DNA_ID=CAMNT_0014090841 /DNA_START=515 /DNA_END=676 /DNA_ORIENTATION=-